MPLHSYAVGQLGKLEPLRRALDYDATVSNTQSLLAFSSVHSDRALLERWPELEVVAEHANVAVPDPSCAHCAASSQASVTSPPTTRLLYRDGPWHVVMCGDLDMIAEEDRLAEASRSLGPILVAMTQGTAGCACFHKYDGGRLVRSIDYADGDLTTAGDPLPEEQGIDIAKLYDEELRRLWRAHGLSGLGLDEDRRDATMIHCIDHQRARPAAHVTAPAAPAKRPWWKIW